MFENVRSLRRGQRTGSQVCVSVDDILGSHAHSSSNIQVCVLQILCHKRWKTSQPRWVQFSLLNFPLAKDNQTRCLRGKTRTLGVKAISFEVDVCWFLCPLLMGIWGTRQRWQRKRVRLYFARSFNIHFITKPVCIKLNKAWAVALRCHTTFSSCHVSVCHLSFQVTLAVMTSYIICRVKEIICSHVVSPCFFPTLCSSDTYVQETHLLPSLLLKHTCVIYQLF